MSTESQIRRTWADEFLDQQKQIVAASLGFKLEEIETAAFDADYYEATDLILPNAKRVSVRVRKFKQLKFSDEICFRDVNLGGIKTEWDKIREGHSDYYLTCWTDPTERSVIKWHLVDLAELRRCQRETYLGGSVKCHSYHDGDDVGLLSYDLRTFPEGYKIVIARS